LDLTPDEFDCWYWTVRELRAFLGSEGVLQAGTKSTLMARVRLLLAGVRPGDGAWSDGGRGATKVRLAGPFSRRTTFAGGVVLTRELREWFESEVGGGFRANAALRDFLASGGDRTLGEAVDAYVAGQGGRRALGTQFEWNRFAAGYVLTHPGSTADELRAAWWEHRSSRRDPG
jgi:hypothetical protein